jgi:hypothetical protein
VVDWNLLLILGLIGIGSVSLCTLWLLVRLFRRRPVPILWWGALAFLFGLSVCSVIGSQITVVSYLSSGDGSKRD